MGDYITVCEQSVGEYSEKHSRFIATLYPCKSEEEAASLLSAHKAKYWDAKHNVYAYILKDKTSKFSDDGEPYSTAGNPVYDCLDHSGICDALIVVTRYFGGILLGTGGLVRAYSSAAKAAIEAAKRVTMVECGIFELTMPYSEQKKITLMLADSGIKILDTVYEESVRIKFAVKLPEIAGFEDTLREISGDKLKAIQVSTEILPIIIKK